MILIRPAREADAKLIAAIGLRAWAEATAVIGMTDALRDNARYAFDGFAHGAWATITVADVDGVVAGWAAREHFDDTISDFWVDPPNHRQGIGTALLAYIERLIVERNFPSAKLESHAQNERAISFFRKNGYAVSWLSMKYSTRLDRDVQTIGLEKQFVEISNDSYGFDF